MRIRACRANQYAAVPVVGLTLVISRKFESHVPLYRHNTCGGAINRRPYTRSTCPDSQDGILKATARRVAVHEALSLCGFAIACGCAGLGSFTPPHNSCGCRVVAGIQTPDWPSGGSVNGTHHAFHRRLCCRLSFSDSLAAGNNAFTRRARVRMSTANLLCGHKFAQHTHPRANTTATHLDEIHARGMT